MGYLFDALRKADERSDGSAPGKQPGAIPDGFVTPLPDDGPEIPENAQTPVESVTEQPNPLPISNFQPSESPSEQPQMNAVDDRLVALTETSTVMAEEYRSIRTGLLARWQQRRNLIHTISSATPQEGKTITTLNLGFSFAELRNRRILIVEADLRLPQFQKLLGLPSSPGLADLLDGKAELEAAIHKVGDSALHVLPAGRAFTGHAVQLLSSAATPALLTRLREKYDHVIIDTPPVLDMADAGILGALSDDVLLVARLERTPRELIERAIHTMGSYNAPVAGLIATDRKRQRHHDYYGYGYRYSRYYQQKKAA